MRTRRILRDEWPRFFGNLSRKQEGWEVTLEVLGSEIGDQVEERHLFLTGITVELSDRPNRPDMIEIMLGGKPDQHLTHVVIGPTEVDLQQSDLGVDSVLQIKATDGTTSLLHFS